MTCDNCKGEEFLTIGFGTHQQSYGFYMPRIPCYLCRCIFCLKSKEFCTCKDESAEGVVLFVS